MPPSSLCSRRPTNKSTVFIMEKCKPAKMFVSTMEIAAGGESCRNKMLAEYEVKTGKSRHKRPLSRVPLWYFLYEILHVEKCKPWITWEDRDNLIFTIKRPKEIATLWGQIKKKEKMTYAKLARGIRYYYGKGVIEKACGKRFSYRFIVSNKTKTVLLGSQSGRDVPKDSTCSRTAAVEWPSNSSAADSLCSRTTSEGLLIPPTKFRRCSSDSSDLTGSYNSSGDSISGDDDDLSEIDLFDYDRLLRELLVEQDIGQPTEVRSSHQRTPSPRDVLLGSDMHIDLSESDHDSMSRSSFDAIHTCLHDAVHTSAFSVVDRNRAPLLHSISARSQTLPANFRYSTEPSTGSLFNVSSASVDNAPVAWLPPITSLAPMPFGMDTLPSHTRTEYSQPPPAKPLPSEVKEESWNWHPSQIEPSFEREDRKHSLDFSALINGGITNSYMSMTQSEIAREYDPLLFENIFMENII